MNLCWITISTSKLEESVNFYTKIIGLNIASRFSSNDGAEIIMLGSFNEPKIELIHRKNTKNDVKCIGISIGFKVDSLDDALKSMKNNNIAIKLGPISPNPHMRFFMVEDPNGAEVQIVEQSNK